jgi:hypothetical protein
VAAPPEVLQWARETLNGITALENKARWGGLQVDSDALETLRRIEAELIEFLDANKMTDPAKWVPPE